MGITNATTNLRASASILLNTGASGNETYCCGTRDAIARQRGALT